MALTRSMLQGMGLTEEQVKAIIEEHDSVKTYLKEQIDKYKADAEKLPKVQKELDELKASGGDWESKYNKEHADFEKYKSDVHGREELEKSKSAYRKLLTSNGIGEKFVDSIMNVTKFDDLKLDNEGKFKNEADLIKNIEANYAGFKVETGSRKTEDPATPPANGGNGKTKEEILKIKDTTERQKAIAENLSLFGH